MASLSPIPFLISPLPPDLSFQPQDNPAASFIGIFPAFTGGIALAFSEQGGYNIGYNM